MRACGSCQQHNPDGARFCLQCGEKFPDEAAASAPPADSTETSPDEEQYWRVLIGSGRCLQFLWSGGWSWRPAWEYYQRMFQRFHSAEGPRFAFTWNWAPFLIEPFLWFLYRKMYLFALVYLVGPIISVFVTADITVPIVWSVIAGTSANYVYYWHLKDIFLKVKAQAGPDPAARMRELADAGGAQPYVLWLVAASLLLKIGFFVAMMGEPSLEQQDFPLPREGVGDRQIL